MQTELEEIENDKIITTNSSFACKILTVTNEAIVFKYHGVKQGIPIRKVEYFRYGVQ
jgi:hypothetical protein